MKKVSLLLVMMLLLIASNADAQQSGNYFVGKWELLILDAPDGDIKMTMSVDRKDEKLEATLQMSAEIKITDIRETENSIKFSFFTSGYDIDLYIEKVDDDNVKGSVADMFDLKGQRIKD
jgi:hypothetical protein